MKKIILILLSVIVIYGVLSAIFGHIKSGRDRSYIVGHNAPLIIAHGGSKQLFPENTMLAFDGIVPFKPDVLEMDVLLTRDSVLITHHDPTINRLSNGKGKVIDYTLEEIKQFNFGYRFKDSAGNYPYRDSLVSPATLEELLCKYGQRFLFCIEIKDYGQAAGPRSADELLRLLQQYGMEKRAMVACFDDDVLAYFRKISGEQVYISSAKRQTKQFVVMNLCLVGNFFTEKSDALQIPVEREGFRLDKRSLIRTAHRKNMAVHYWTINDEQEMERLIRLGADGIITDRADIADLLLHKMGYRK
jgi:glycerophosphoryl diester phosphodiesterase